MKLSDDAQNFLAGCLVAGVFVVPSAIWIYFFGPLSYALVCLFLGLFGSLFSPEKGRRAGGGGRNHGQALARNLSGSVKLISGNFGAGKRRKTKSGW